MSKTILEFKNVCQYFEQAGSKLEVLKDINLKVNEGELVALVGPSGAGKSTLLHIAGFLEQQKSGNLFIEERDVSNLKEKEKTKIRRDFIGFVYQYHHLLPEFSALENVMMPQIIAKGRESSFKKQATEILSKMGLKDRIDHRPAELSGGEQQRVAIARALSNNPKLILADEPTGNLDPKTGDDLFKLLNTLVKEQKSAALIVTHNMEIARKCDRIYSLENGILKE